MLNFNIGKSFLNERLTFTFGSAVDFGLSQQQVQATKNLQFLPDISADLKLRQDGKVVLHLLLPRFIQLPLGYRRPPKPFRRQASAIAAILNVSAYGGLIKRKKLRPPLVDTSRVDTGSN